MPLTMPIIPAIVQQHFDDAALLHASRTNLCRAPHAALRDLHKFDDRLCANLDGLTIAGEHAWEFCDAALESPSAAVVFTAAVRAIEDRNPMKLERLLALAEAVFESRSGLLSAFGWLAREQLQGIVASQLASTVPFRRMVGIAACGMHRVDPGIIASRRLQDLTPLVRARALRAAGELGRDEASPACVAAIQDSDPECSFWGAWSAVLLGNRGAALEALAKTSVADSCHRYRAFRLALQAMDTNRSHQMLQHLGGDPVQLRWLIQGSGLAGDPKYVPWLIAQMANDNTARIAGEAFTLITGADFIESELERSQPTDFQSGPNDNPDEADVAMDVDEGLPWPDTRKIQTWWAANSNRFERGTRYFMGKPVTRAHCVAVVKNGFQRQRILAAHYLCLLEPGTPLFNTSAPAWRQQRLLATLT